MIIIPAAFAAAIHLASSTTQGRENIAAIERTFDADVVPLAIVVAYCESGLKQFDADGKVLSGRIVPQDRGLFQINQTYHLAKSLEMGLDIETVEGNIAYAKYLYDTQGFGPWSASKACWSPVEHNPPPTIEKGAWELLGSPAGIQIDHGDMIYIEVLGNSNIA